MEQEKQEALIEQQRAYIKENLQHDINLLFQKLVQTRRKLHQYPELLYDTPITLSLIEDYLLQLKIPYEKNVGNHFKRAIVVKVNGEAAEGKTILFRADIDGLPLTEQTLLPYSSVIAGQMHACGHDVHTTILLGVTELLYQQKAYLRGSYICVFQPAEEGAKRSPLTGQLLSGGRDLVMSNICKDVDEAYAIHVWPQFDSRHIALHEAQVMAGSSHFDLKFIGRSAHQSTPQEGVDAIQMAVSFMIQIQQWYTTHRTPEEHGIIAIGKIRGGEARNAIADCCELSGTLRAFNKQTLKALEDEVLKRAQMVSHLFAGHYELSLREGMPLINSTGVVKKLQALVSSIDAPYKLNVLNKPYFTGDDFAWYLNEVAGAYVLIGCQTDEQRQAINSQLHQTNFQIDEHCINTGVHLFMSIALDN